MTAVATPPLPRPQAAAPFWRRRPFAVVIAVVFLLNLPPLMYPMGWDQATYGYYGQEILRGHVPYRDFWEINTPGNFLLYTLAVALFGGNGLAVNLLGLAEALATAALLYRLTARWLGTRHAVVATLLYGATCALGFDYWGREEPEAALGLATVAGLALVQAGDDRPRFRLATWFLAGIVGAAAVLVKPTGAVVPLIVMAYRLLMARPAGVRAMAAEVTAAALGFVLLAGGALVYLAATGALSLFLQQLTEYNVRYAQSSVDLGTREFLVRVVIRFVLEVGPVPLLALAGSLQVVRQRAAGRTGRFLLAWAGLALLTLVAQAFRHHYHYYMLLPVISVLGAVFLLSVRWRAAFAPGRRAVLVAACLGALYAGLFVNANRGRFAGYMAAAPAAVGLLPASSYRPLFFWPGHWTPGREELAAYLTCHTEYGEPAYVTGEPAAYFLAGVEAPTRFYHEVPLAFSGQPDRLVDQYVAALAAAPPAYVAFYDSPLMEYVPQRQLIKERVAPLLATSYTPALVRDSLAIYRLSSLADTPSSRCRS